MKEMYTTFYPLICGLSTMILCQCYKFIKISISEKKWHIYHVFYSGGMPSSHSGLVISLTTAIGIKDGFGSSTFFIAIVFALIVLYDSAGVRHSVGIHSKTINTIIDDWNKKMSDRPLKRAPVVMGHTPNEIFAGAIFGIGIAYSMSMWMAKS